MVKSILIDPVVVEVLNCTSASLMLVFIKVLSSVLEEVHDNVDKIITLEDVFFVFLAYLNFIEGSSSQENEENNEESRKLFEGLISTFITKSQNKCFSKEFLDAFMPKFLSLQVSSTSNLQTLTLWIARFIPSTFDFFKEYFCKNIQLNACFHYV
jgi:hypothetical protein